VQRLYNSGQQAGLGINLNVFCIQGRRPYCYIWLPKDEEDASYRMLNGLKLSVPTGDSRRHAELVSSRIRWSWLKFRERRNRRTKWADEIPGRLC
jgi:hypothetical protein